MVILRDVKLEDAEKVFSRFVASSSKICLANKSKNYDSLDIDINQNSAAANLFRLYQSRYDTATFYREGRFLRLFLTLEEIGKMKKVDGGYIAQTDESFKTILSEWLKVDESIDR